MDIRKENLDIAWLHTFLKKSFKEGCIPTNKEEFEKKLIYTDEWYANMLTFKNSLSKLKNDDVTVIFSIAYLIIPKRSITFLNCNDEIEKLFKIPLMNLQYQNYIAHTYPKTARGLKNYREEIKNLSKSNYDSCRLDIELMFSDNTPLPEWKKELKKESFVKYQQALENFKEQYQQVLLSVDRRIAELEEKEKDIDTTSK